METPGRLGNRTAHQDFVFGNGVGDLGDEQGAPEAKLDFQPDVVAQGGFVDSRQVGGEGRRHHVGDAIHVGLRPRSSRVTVKKLVWHDGNSLRVRS